MSKQCECAAHSAAECCCGAWDEPNYKALWEQMCQRCDELDAKLLEAEKENALQALHTENERLGLYKDAYGKPEQCTYPNCPYPCMDLPDCIEEEPVAHLWECLGRWSAYLVNNGMQAECAPPSWLVDAVKNATAPPQRTWVGLTDEEENALIPDPDGSAEANVKRVEVLPGAWGKEYEEVDAWSKPLVLQMLHNHEAKLKQKNGYAEENT